ncbi:MAG: nicotinate (nicotinamide) nucleotide adenylyltransferase [Lentisphaeria bacterium]|nr:nicotinate (nicotinamide) nucleotide adenylyltransferase [Lentisphaeria bacterium]
MPDLTAFFGGSFDPPHLGHLGVAGGALFSGLCRKVVWVPAWAQPQKQGGAAASFRHRLAMVRLLIRDHANMTASDIEERLRLQPSYTVDVMEHFAAELPEGETPALLIGADSLLALHTWHRAEELARSYAILTYPRNGFAVSREALAAHWEENLVEKLLSGVIGGEFFEISSTEVRKTMAKITNRGHIIEAESSPLSGAVREYCEKYALYGIESEGCSMEDTVGKTKHDPAELARFCVKCAEEKLAENVVSLPVGKVSSIADFIVIATVNSEPQLRALAGFTEREMLEKLGKKTLHRPEISADGCGWALLDFGTVIFHIMTPETRARYDLETLWGKSGQ